MKPKTVNHSLLKSSLGLVRMTERPLDPNRKSKRSKRGAGSGLLMFANSFGGINLNVVAQDSIVAATPYLTPLSWFTTDFSDEVSAGGVDVATRIPGIMTMGDMTTGGSTQDLSSTEVKVTLNKTRGGKALITEDEVYKAGRSPDWFLNTFVTPAIEAMCYDMLNQIGAVFTTTHFDSSGGRTNTAVYASSAQAYAKLNLIKKQADVNKAARQNRSFIFNAAYMAPLLEDATILKLLEAGKSSVMEEGVLGRILGHRLPDSGVEWIPGNSINLVGLAVTPRAAAFAARTVHVPETGRAMYQNVVHAETGLRFQIRLWYSDDDNCYYFAIKYVCGAAAASKSDAVLVLSA